MDLTGWNERYRTGERAGEDLLAPPTPLLMETASALQPGRALDLACGSGRNALWLGEHGWRVTAVDGSTEAIAVLAARAKERGLEVETAVADLEAGEYVIERAAWDLIVIAYYLQRGLFDDAKAGVKPGGVLLAIVHIAAPGEEITAHRAAPGELRSLFAGWEIIHDYEGAPRDEAHRRGVAEIVARRPLR